MERKMVLGGWRERDSKIEENKPGVEREKIKFKTKIKKEKDKGKWGKKREE